MDTGKALEYIRSAEQHDALCINRISREARADIALADQGLMFYRDKSGHPATPWHAIRTIGNKLRHEYQRISDIILWGVITSHAETLKTTVDAILAKHSNQNP